MRYLYAAITLLLGLVLLGLGIGQLSTDSEETLQTEGAQDAPFTVVTDGIIDAEAGRDELTIEAEGEYTLAVGRIYDIEAWIDDAAFNRVTGIAEGEDDESSHIEAEHVEGEAEAPNPAESDLWVATESTEGDLLYRWNAPDESGDWALLIFRDGEEPAPTAITVEQTESASSVGGIILLIGGGLLTLLALVLFFWARGSHSRSAGPDDDSRPRDEQAEDPVTQPTDETATAETDHDGVVPPRRETDTGRAERRVGPRSMLSGLTAALLGAGAVFGVGGPAHADQDGADEAEETQEEPDDAAEAPEETDQPEEADAPDAEELDAEADEDVEVEDEIPAEGYSVLLSSQLDGILAGIAETVEAGDAEQDPELLEDRVAGQALAVRETAYRNHDLAGTELPAPVGTEVLSAAVTSDQDFPRQAMVLTDHPDTEVPQILILEQESPRDNYKLIHTTMMAPGTEFPSLSPEQGGTAPVAADAEINGVTPVQAVSGIAGYFTDPDDDFGDGLADSIYVNSLHDYYQDLAEAADDTEVSFPEPEPDEDLTTLELPDGSAVVAGSFEMVMQMAPLEDGDTIFLDHDLVVELVDTDWTTFPTEIYTSESVVLHIPAEDSEEEAVLLGVHDIIEDASIDTPEWFDGYDGE